MSIFIIHHFTPNPMHVSLKLHGAPNVTNQFDADRLKDLTQTMHVADLLAIVEKHVAEEAKKAAK